MNHHMERVEKIGLVHKTLSQPQAKVTVKWNILLEQETRQAADTDSTFTPPIN